MYIPLEEIDRALYRAIELKLIEKGLWLDVREYQNNRKRFNADLKELEKRNGYGCFVVPKAVGTWQSKEEQIISSVAIIRNSINRDGIASTDDYFYSGMYVRDGMQEVYITDDTGYITNAEGYIPRMVEKSFIFLGKDKKYQENLMRYIQTYYPEAEWGSKFTELSQNIYYKKFKYPQFQRIVQYDIRVLTNTEKMFRVLQKLIYETFEYRGYMNPVIADGNFDTRRHFFYTSQDIINMTSDRVYEWSFPFFVGGVWIDKPKEMQKIRQLLKVNGYIIVKGDLKENSFDYQTEENIENTYLFETNVDSLKIK